MRIDPLQVAAIMNQADLASVRPDPKPQKIQQESPLPQLPKSAAVALPAPTQLSVSIDSDKNVIYEFLDARTGELVQQIPPEQVLKIMRSIADLLRQSEQKLEITI